MSKKILSFGLFACLLLLMAPTLSAQKIADLKRNGEKQYANRQWAEAATALGQYQQEKPGDPGVLTKLGICNYHLHQADKAQQYLEFVLQKNPKSADADLHYYLARTLHGRSEFERAIAAYKGFLRISGDKHPLRANAVENIRRCASGLGIRANPDVALVENLGDRVNSTGDEFAPLPSVNHPGRIYFSAARENCTGGRRNEQGYEDPDAGHWCSDMFFSNLTNSGWNYATLLGDLLNTPRFEVALDFNSTGQILYFFRGFTLYSGEILADTSGQNAVTSPAFTSPMLPEEGDIAPFLVNDTLLLFASRRPDGQGGLDLYYATRNDSGWAAPRNLGPTINSPYDETTPFLARDGRTLYFSSNHPGSMGGFDVFKSVFDETSQTWSAPVNLGKPVNSPGDDAFFRLSLDGLTAFFSSDRLDSYGARDIYMAYFKQERTEQLADRLLFTDVAKKANALATIQSGPKPVEKVTLPVLYYNTDNDVLREENKNTLSEVAHLARLHPEAQILVHVHTDETGPAKFDLYYGIKRAEIVGKALTDRGIPARRISLKSFGSAYPVARNVLDAVPNPLGQRLNRRIEVSFASVERTLALEQTIQRQIVPEDMAIRSIEPVETRFAGLAYRVEAVTARQILANDALGMFSDLMIESEPESGSYRYSAGLYRTFAEAVAQRRALQAQGFPDASISAYIDGLRISRAEAIGLQKKFPDLAAFIKN
jgi:outer membrane protein OmpA-like peptidoglycan-associated protein/tetratricopeptide (TPR) repeat protein